MNLVFIVEPLREIDVSCIKISWSYVIVKHRKFMDLYGPRYIIHNIPGKILCIWCLSVIYLKQFHSVTQVGLALTVIELPQPPACLDYRHEFPCLAKIPLGGKYTRKLTFLVGFEGTPLLLQYSGGRRRRISRWSIVWAVYQEIFFWGWRDGSTVKGTCCSFRGDPGLVSTTHIR